MRQAAAARVAALDGDLQDDADDHGRDDGGIAAVGGPLRQAFGDDAAHDAQRVGHLRRHLAHLVVLAEQQVGEEGGVLVEGLAEAADQGGELALEGRLGLLHGLGGLAEGGELVGEEAPGEVVLAGVVAVEGALGDAGGAGDVADRGLGDALLDEQAERLAGDPLSGSGAVAHGGSPGFAM
jgi:hypothetical protein